MLSKLIRLIGVVFSNSTMLSVSDRSDSINERTHADQQQNKITYSVGVPEVPMNKLRQPANTAVHRNSSL